MATIDPPFGKLSLGNHALQASLPLIGWKTLGQCTITKNDSYTFAASGSYNALGHSGTFDFTLVLPDKNPSATSGPCTITMSGHTIKGSYTRTGSSISFADNEHSISASPDSGKNVALQVSGYPKARIVG